MAISPARQIAFDVLRRVGAESGYASDLLFAQLGPAIARADAALATELTLGVLRWQRLLDFLLARHLDRPAERLDDEVLLALRLGLYQLRFLDRVPAHAAVSESVELAKRARKSSAASLVNAVLRRAAPQARISGKELHALIPEGVSPCERAAIVHSHPTWLVERWFHNFGNERTIALLEANNRAARLCCAVLDPAQSPHIAAELRAAGLAVAPGQWLRSTLTISGANPTAAEPYRLGKISLQDEASQMVAHLVDAKPGQRVLDVCAAPGGKAVLLARAVAPNGTVVAADLHHHRLRILQEQLIRTHTGNVSPIALDATRPLPFEPQFDGILVDAPCSGTGTLSRNPEIRWRLKAEELSRAHDYQVSMLRQSLAVLAPGGRLVYSTCSLEPEENEGVVREVLADKGWRLISGQASLAADLHDARSSAAAALFVRQDFFQTFPPECGTDGFFAAVFARA
jgi:16S rRNA (cytosine967-C5)-methyltransferase